MKSRNSYTNWELTLNALESSRKNESWLRTQLQGQKSMRDKADRVPNLEQDLKYVQSQYDCLKGAIVDTLAGGGNRRTLAFSLECAESLDSDPMLMEVATMLYTDRALSAKEVCKAGAETPKLAAIAAGKENSERITNHE